MLQLILLIYRKIPIISPGLILVQKAFLLDLISGKLIFGWANYWKEFRLSKWNGLDNKNCLKHYENSLKQLNTVSNNSPWAYIRESLLSEGFLRLRFRGLIFGRASFLGGRGEGLLSEFYRVFVRKDVLKTKINRLIAAIFCLGGLYGRTALTLELLKRDAACGLHELVHENAPWQLSSITVILNCDIYTAKKHKKRPFSSETALSRHHRTAEISKIQDAVF